VTVRAGGRYRPTGTADGAGPPAPGGPAVKGYTDFRRTQGATYRTIPRTVMWTSIVSYDENLRKYGYAVARVVGAPHVIRYMSAGKGAACTPYSFAGSAENGAKDRGVLAATQARAPCFGPVSAVTAHTTCSSHQFVITPFIMRCCSDLSPQQRLLEFW
jgi:hypothetical protein